MKPQLFLLSVCLFASFSASAAAVVLPAAAAELPAVAPAEHAAAAVPLSEQAIHEADSLRFAAIMCERAYYFACEEQSDPSAAESLLLEKASLLLRAGEGEQALGTLMRVNAFFLNSEDRERYTQMLDSLSQDAAVTGEQQDAAVTGEQQDLNGAKGYPALWAFVPPVGHCLAGKPARGVLMALLDAGELAFGIWQACSGNWITAYLVGAGGLYLTYFTEGVRIVPEITRQFKNNP